MICLSHKGTLNLIDEIGKDHDTLPKLWKSDLVGRIEVAIYIHLLYVVQIIFV